MIEVHYEERGLEKVVRRVWSDWSDEDSVVYLVANEFGVYGAVIVQDTGDFEKEWSTAYDCAIDEIVHDAGDFDSDEDLQVALDEGTATYRNSGTPSNPQLKTGIADTRHLSLIRCSGAVVKEVEGAK